MIKVPNKKTKHVHDSLFFTILSPSNLSPSQSPITIHLLRSPIYRLRSPSPSSLTVELYIVKFQSHSHLHPLRLSFFAELIVLHRSPIELRSRRSNFAIPFPLSLKGKLIKFLFCLFAISVSTSRCHCSYLIHVFARFWIKIFRQFYVSPFLICSTLILFLNPFIFSFSVSGDCLMMNWNNNWIN